MLFLIATLLHASLVLGRPTDLGTFNLTEFSISREPEDAVMGKVVQFRISDSATPNLKSSLCSSTFALSTLDNATVEGTHQVFCDDDSFNVQLIGDKLHESHVDFLITHR